MQYLKKDGNVVRVADGEALEGYEEATQAEYVAEMSKSEDWPAVKANLEAEGEVFPEDAEMLLNEDGTPVTGELQEDGSYKLSDGSTAPSEDQVAAE